MSRTFRSRLPLWPFSWTLQLVLALLILVAGPAAPAVPALAQPVQETALTPLGAAPGLAPGRVEIGLPVLSYSEGEDGEAGFSMDVYRIVVERNPQPRLRVGFLERVAGGIGDEMRYSAWLSAIVASQRAGLLLDDLTITFDVYDHVDGPSAGGIMTTAVLAALLGHELDPRVAMTGTIHPDGTIGPVGGIAQKIMAASEGGLTTVLIPRGQRFERTDEGETLDLFAHGSSLGVDVVEVGDIDTAYALITGHALPRFRPAADMSTAVPQWLADELRTMYEATDVYVEDLLETMAELGQDSEPSMLQPMADAREALAAGRVALAYARMNLAAREASREMFLLLSRVEQAAERGDLDALAEALELFAEELEASAAILEEMENDLDGLPVDVAQVPFLLDLYGLARAAWEALDWGESAVLEAAELLEEHSTARLNRIERQRLVADARHRLERAAAWQSLADDLLSQAYDRRLMLLAAPAAGLSPDPVLAARLADVQRSAAWAALMYFNQLVPAALAGELEVYEWTVMERFMDEDVDIALALPMVQGLPASEEELMDPYMMLGAALHAYHRLGRAVHVHYTLSPFPWEDFPDNINPELLDHLLDVAEANARAAIARTQAAGLDPALSLVYLEIADGLRQGDTASRLEAMAHYWQAEALARIMATLAR